MDLREDGYRGRIVAIDYVPAAISVLRDSVLGGEKLVRKAGIELLEMDAREMSFEDGSFDGVLDKVCLYMLFLRGPERASAYTC